MSGQKFMLIFNNYEFRESPYFNTKPSTLIGTVSDVVQLRRVFENFGFQVIVHTNNDYDEIYNAVVSLSRLDHRRTACVCIAVLSHGRENGQVAAADKPYELNELLRRLQHGDAGLVGKPKILLAQACRGYECDPGRIELDHDAPRCHVLPTHADTLVVYASVEDHTSWVDPDGTWLLKEVCHVLGSPHVELDALQMFTVVAGLVARNYETSWEARPDLARIKQMPEICSTLTKLLHFKRSPRAVNRPTN